MQQCHVQQCHLHKCTDEVTRVCAKECKVNPSIVSKRTPAGGHMVSLHQCKKCQGVLFQLFRHNLDALEVI